MKLELVLVCCLAVGLSSAEDLTYRPPGLFDKMKMGAQMLGKMAMGLFQSDNVQDYEVGWEGKPWFCHELDCPNFKVIEKTADYELREYSATSWMSTSLEGNNFRSSMYTMFMKLFRYIDGNNKGGRKIEMTCPVLDKVTPNEDYSAFLENFEMMFYNIPSLTPPEPNDADVKVTQLPKLRAYVRSFSGFASASDYLSEAKALEQALPSTASYVKDYIYTAGYDAPYKLFNRHNEVWFIVQ